jgi:hypothetical protein
LAEDAIKHEQQQTKSEDDKMELEKIDSYYKNDPGSNNDSKIQDQLDQKSNGKKQRDTINIKSLKLSSETYGIQFSKEVDYSSSSVRILIFR